MNALSTLTVAALVMLQSAAAAEPPPGAAACTGCHAASLAIETPVPRIHGRKAEEMLAAMAEFRSGQKPATVMNRIAKGFTDEEMKPIAAWLAEQK